MPRFQFSKSLKQNNKQRGPSPSTTIHKVANKSMKRHLPKQSYQTFFHLLSWWMDMYHPFFFLSSIVFLFSPLLCFSPPESFHLFVWPDALDTDVGQNLSRSGSQPAGCPGIMVAEKQKLRPVLEIRPAQPELRCPKTCFFSFVFLDAMILNPWFLATKRVFQSKTMLFMLEIRKP